MRVTVAIRNRLASYGMQRMLVATGLVDEIHVAGSVAEYLAQPGAAAGSAVEILAYQELRDLAQPRDRSARAARTLLLLDPGHPVPAPPARTADGVLLSEGLTVEQLTDALRGVRVHQPPPARPQRRAENHLSRPQLTRREREVLVLLVDGLSNKQAARLLGITEHGVKRLVSSVLGKLNVPNRTMAAVRALDHGELIAPDRRHHEL